MVWETFNVLFVLRVCVKFFVEKIKEEEVIKQFEVRPKEDDKKSEEEKSRFELFVHSLVDVIAQVPQT